MEQQLRSMIKQAIEGPSEVHWVAAPDSTPFPQVILSTASTVGGHTMDGPMPLKDSIVQVDVWALTYTDSADLRDQILMIDGFTGEDAIRAVLLETVSTGIDTSSDQRLYRQMMRFRIFHAKT